jgi:Phosphatidylglycerophosphate synthase
MLDLYRNQFKGLENRVAGIFARLPLTPNQYTACSVAAAFAALCFLIIGGYWVALALFAVAATLDFIDGAVARAKNLANKKGAYWDTIADRYVEATLLFGFLFVELPVFFMPAPAWIFLVLFGSMMTTYAKAAAKEKGLSDLELKGGLLSRAERLIIFAVVIASLNYYPALASFLLAALAILTNVTAAQRIKKALLLK